MIAEVAAMVAAEPLAATPIPSPQFGNSPDSGRPPVEQFPRPMPAPSGRPETTAPQFPALKTSARERLSGPGPLAPSGQPDPHRRGDSSAGPLRWARCPDDGRLHLLAPAEVVVASGGGHAEALCGRALPAEGLTLTNGSSGAVCMACMDGIPSNPGPKGAS